MKKAIQRAAALALSGLLLCTSAQAAGSYADVPEDAWYMEAAEYCREKGLMNGTSESEFSPNLPVTRAQLCVALYRMSGSTAAEEGNCPFEDVKTGDWCGPAVLWASRKGYMNGYSNGRFAPRDPVTRQQLAAVLWRYQGSPAAAAPDFADESDIAPGFSQAVDWARQAGVMEGLSDGRFAPKMPVTRAQLAAVLMKSGTPGGVTAVNVLDVMCQPSGAAVTEDGSLLVTDTYNRVIWRVKDGTAVVYAGGDTRGDLYGQPIGGYNDGALRESYFKTPWAIAPFLDGWAVSDADNGVVRVLRAEGAGTLNGHTSEKGLTATKLGVAFQHPTGLAAGGEGNLYVSDTFADAVRRITPDGEVTTAASHLSEPMGLCWHNGALYIAETGANRVVKLEDGEITLVAGSGESDYIDGPAAEAAFSSPQGVAVGEDGAVYVSDTGNSAIRKVLNGQVTTLAARDVTDLRSFFPISPTGLLAAGDQLYICDPFARKLLVYPLH